MIDLNNLLVTVLYISLIILVIIFIVLGIKLIETLKKVDSVLDDVNTKMDKVDGVFNIIDKTTDYAVSVSDKVTSLITSGINRLLKRKKGNDDDE